MWSEYTLSFQFLFHTVASHRFPPSVLKLFCSDRNARSDVCTSNVLEVLSTVQYSGVKGACCQNYAFCQLFTCAFIAGHYTCAFTVSDAGKGTPEVIILDPAGRENTVPAKLRKEPNGAFVCDYTPAVQGVHSVNVFFAGQPVPRSPFAVGVANGNVLKKKEDQQ